MDIFSKRDGPRREDVRAKKLISDNAPTIRKLADQLSNGGYSRMRADQKRRNEQPKPKGLIIHDLKARVTVDEPEPYVKVSLNGRVVLVDANSGRQLQFLGEIRGNFMATHFKLATKENGFFSPLPEEFSDAIRHLDNVELSRDFTEEVLARTISECLDLSKDE